MSDETYSLVALVSSTSPIPSDEGTFEIEFDFIDHRLRVSTSEGAQHSFKLEPMSVARFYEQIMQTLTALGIEVEISTRPSEVANPVDFTSDSNRAPTIPMRSSDSGASS